MYLPCYKLAFNNRDICCNFLDSVFIVDANYFLCVTVWVFFGSCIALWQRLRAR